MTEGKRRLDRIVEAAYLQGLKEVPLARLREMRQECIEEESLLSYERRLLHGRIAILRAELARRAGGGESSLVEMLPKILADERRSSRGSFPGLDPGVEFQIPQRRVSKLVSDDTLANLPTLEEEEIIKVLEDLERTEREVSRTRKPLLDVLDRLSLELARRYASGEADPSDVLSSER